jgi:hypothetical protein
MMLESAKWECRWLQPGNVAEIDVRIPHLQAGAASAKRCVNRA